MGLTWSIYNRDNQLLSRLGERSGGQVVGTLNGDRAASVTIPLDSDAAAHALALRRFLHVRLDGEVLHHGPIMQPRAGAGQGDPGTITLESVGPSVQLSRMFHFVFHEEDPDQVTGFNMPDGLIQMVLIATAADRYAAGGQPGHTIDWGPGGFLNPPNPHVVGPFRQLGLPDGSNIWDTMTRLANMDGGTDFEFQPLLNDLYTHIFRTYAGGQGADKTGSVRWEWGWGKENVLSWAHAPDGSGVVTRAFVIGPDPTVAGRSPLVADVYHDAAVAELGAWANVITRQDLQSHAALGKVGAGEVGAKREPVSVLELASAPPQDQIATFNANVRREGKPRYGAGYKVAPPECGGDVWLGDTVAFSARKGRYRLEYEGRVTTATITEQEGTGALLGTVQCAPALTATGMSQDNWTL